MCGGAEKRVYMKNSLSYIIAVIAALIPCGMSGAYQFRTLPHNEDLSSKMVNTIFQDDDGLVYIGTASGLDRYDGYRVQSFVCDKSDSTSIHDNFVEDIQKAPDGRLWVRAGDSYSIFDPATEKFDRNVESVLRACGINGEPVRIRIADSGIWCAVKDKGIYRCSGQEGARTVEGSASLLGDDEVTDIIVPQDGRVVYAVSRKGRLIIINAGNMTVADVMDVPLSGSFPDMVYGMMADRDGLIWIYGESGLFACSPARKEWIDNIAGRQWPAGKVKAAAQDHKGRIWVGYDHKGVAVIDKTGAVAVLKSSEFDDSTLPANTVTALMEDKTGTMWVGTRKKGAALYSESLFKFGFHRLPDVNCITTGPGGCLWVGTDADGVYRLDSAFNIVESYKDSDDQNAVVSLLAMPDGTVWVGTYDGGLKCIRDGAMRSFGVSDGLVSRNIWGLLSLDGRRIMIATLDGGIQIFDPDDNSFVTYDTSNSGLVSRYVSSISPDGKGNVYIGTSEGMSVFDIASGRISRLNGSKSGKQLFSNQNINQVLVDSRGLVWVATRDGLDVYDPERDTITNVPLGSDNFYRFICGIIEDRDNSMWISAGSTLVNVKPVVGGADGRLEFDIRKYDDSDGLQKCDFNQRSFCRLPDGEVLVGGLFGINSIRHEDILLNTFVPKVTFTDLYLYNKEVAVGREYDGIVLLPKSLDHLSEITLKSSQNEFAISLATDDYIMPEKTRYSYRLDGFNAEWTELPEGYNWVSYTNLSPGKYVLRVRAVNNDGIPSSEESVLKIHILPPFYASLWAKILYAALACALVVWVIFYVRRREREAVMRSSKEEQDRKHEELNQLKFKFFTNISHDLRTPLTLIMSPVESMLKENRDERDIRRLNTVRSNARGLMSLVDQLLDFRKNEMVGLKLSLASGDVVKTVRDVADRFADIADRRKINLSFSASVESHEMEFDDDKLRKSIMNLISNAIKYTPDGGDIHVAVDVADGMVGISVADSGGGVADEDKARVFDRFFRSASQSGHISGSGIGLSLVQEYVRLHGGSVSVADNSPHGAVFTIVLPDRGASHVAANAPDAPSAAQADGGRPRVLFVDDNHDLTDFLRDEFSGSYEVTTAPDGAAALELLAASRFDIVVSDVMMPHVDGIQLCRAMKADPHTVDIPLILLTAKRDVGAVIEGLTLGADDYVTKPFNNEVLGLKIRHLLSLRRRGLKGTRIEPTPCDIEITPLDEQLVAKAVKYVEQNMSRSELSVEELSAHMGMSRVNLYKKLLALTGKSPIEFIRVMRLKRAAQYLRESQLNVAEIAYRTGFNNPKYFSRYFKAEYGVSPSEYQEKQGV